MKINITSPNVYYFILLLGLIAVYGTSLNGQPCSSLSDNFNLGGAAHDSGFQENDAINSTATLSNGNFVVAWETRDGVDGDENGGFFQVFSEDGTVVTAVTMPYADINAAGTGDQGTFGPKVVALETGFVIAWESEDGPGDSGPVGDTQQDIYFRIYNNAGNPITGSTRISVPEEEDQLSFILPLNTGGFVVLCHIDEDNSGNKDDFFFQAFNASGEDISGGLVNISGGLHDAFFQSVDPAHPMVDLGGGIFAVTWESRNDADGDGNGGFFRIFNTNGTPVTGVTIPYADINSAGTGDQGTPGPKVIGLANGNFVVAWESEQGPGDAGPSSSGPGDSNNQDVYFRIYNANGTAVLGTIKANSDNTADKEQLNEIIELTGGNFAILYHRDESAPGNNKDDYFVRTFTSSGTPAGNSIEISSGAHTEAFCTVLANRGFIALNNGNFVVGWAARDDVDGDDAGAYYRVFDATGATVSPVVFPYQDINSAGTGKQSTSGPILKTLPDGFTIAWQSLQGPGDIGPVGDEQDVYHRVFDNSGTALCGSTKTNAGNDAEEELLIAVQALANGNFAVVYKDDEDNTGNKDDYFVRVIGGAPSQIICPALGMASVSDPAVCVDEAFNITVTGLQNMDMATNNEQNYGVSFVSFANSTSNPYNGGTPLGTVAFGNLTGGGTTATLTGISINTADPDLFIYAILDAAPADAGCAPTAETMISISAFPSVIFNAPPDFCISAGVQTGLGGGTPTGGVYSGAGVTDDGNGISYSFNPVTVGAGSHNITYSFANANGCSGTVSDAVEVFAEPTVAFTAPTDVCLDAVMQTGQGGGTPTGGTYSGPGVTDSGNGMTYTFDPAAAGVGTHTITYNFDINGCSGMASDGIEVFALPSVSISLPDTIFAIDGMPPLNVVGGGLPVGGVYTDMFDETMDDGNGVTFSFLSNFLVGDINVITYTYTDINGCSNSASHTIFVADGTVGIDQLAALQVEVFPNPTTGLLHLKGVEIDQVEVIDIHGRVLQVEPQPDTSIDISSLPAGLYFLRLEVDGQQYSARVVKE